MANSRLLISADLNGNTPVIAAGTAVVGEYERLRDFLDSRAPGLSSLFSEPVFGPKTPTGYRNASWYTTVDGEAVPLTELSQGMRAAVGQQLADQIEALRPLISDPKFGALLRHALLLPSLDSVMLVGNQPVLVKWGFVPSSLPQSPAALERHFKATFGSFVGWSPLDAEPDVPPLPFAAPPSAATPSAAEPPPATPVPPVRPAAAPTPPLPPPAADRPWGLRGTALAALLVLFLLVGLLLGLLWCGFQPVGWWSRTGALAPTDRQEIQRGVLDALQDERDRLAQLLNGDVCQAEPSQLPGHALTLPVRPTIPGGPAGKDPPKDPPKDQASGAKEGSATTPAPPAASAPGIPLNAYLERSTVMILTDTGLGSGFFVAPDLIVTNRHVVSGKGETVAGEVLVTSKALGRVYEATIAAVTPNSDIGERDYAVLRLKQVPDPAPVTLPLARSVEKRTTVIAAGFPGYLVQHDPAMVRLMKGDASAAPEMVLTEGKVQVVHVPQGGVPVVVHSADISQGNSGGPLVDDCGRVVGINTFIGMDKESGRRGLFSLGAADLAAFLTRNQMPVTVQDGACNAAAR